MQQRSRGLWIGLAIAIAVLSWWLALAGPAQEDGVLAAAANEPTAAAPSATPPPATPSPTPVAPTPAPEPPLEPEPDPPPLAAAVRAPEPTDSIAPIPPDTRGFVDALESRFEAEPRDSAASEVETKLRRLFRGPRMPASLLQSVLCRQSVCKLEVSWLPQHDPVYRHVLGQLTGDNAKFLATRAGPADARGAIPVEVFWVRAQADVPE